MRTLDRIIQAWRARVARPWIPAGARVLDIGCHQGEFLNSLGDRIRPSLGLDPLARPVHGSRHQLLPILFSEPLSFADASFDAIVLLATLEHLSERNAMARECYRLLRPGGQVVITVPSPKVDLILALLCRLRLTDGMSLEQHNGFDPRSTPEFFSRQGFGLQHWRRFQFGLNHLFVFRKPIATAAEFSIGNSTPASVGSLAHA